MTFKARAGRRSRSIEEVNQVVKMKLKPFCSAEKGNYSKIIGAERQLQATIKILIDGSASLDNFDC
jgi:hypothetical protein